MTQDEAEAFLHRYRALLKDWTMSVAGINRGDIDAIQLKLNEGQYRLMEIATAFPEKAYSVDLLVNARKRTWAGFQDNRVHRSGA